MDDTGHDFFARPPWSGQPVRPWIRFFAWIYLLAALIAGGIGVALLMSEGDFSATRLAVILPGLVGHLYFSAVLLHVAINGVAPAAWIPWK